MTRIDPAHTPVYMCVLRGRQLGPFSESQLKRMASMGSLQPDNLVWKPGMDEWLPASQIQGLFTAEAAPPAPVRRPAQGTAPRTEPSDPPHREPPRPPQLRAITSPPDSRTAAARRSEPPRAPVEADRNRRSVQEPAAGRPPAPQNAPGLVDGTVDFPVVRIIPSFWRTRVMAVYRGHLLLGSRYIFSLSVTEDLLAEEDGKELRSRLHRCQEVLFSDVTEVYEVCSRPLQNDDQALAQKGDARIFFDRRNGRTVRLKLPSDQASQVREVLARVLGTRYSIAEPRPTSVLEVIKLIAWWTATIVLLVLLMTGIAIQNGMTIAASAVGLSILSLLAAARHFAFRREQGLSWEAWSQPVANNSLPLFRRRLLGGLVARAFKGPFRSKPLGWTLKVLGLLYYFLIMSPATDGWAQHLPEQQRNNSYITSTMWAVVCAPAAILVYFGYRFCQSSFNAVDRGDARRPILFLRPFSDDRSTSLQPSGMLSRLAGVRADSGVPGHRATQGRVSQADLLMSVHPGRLIRMFFDIGVDTSEESLTRFFSTYGPVVAIGRPGEPICTPGAHRMYVDDKSWQAAVHSEFRRAQAIVIQPGTSAGVKWELDQIRRHVRPCQVLFCLAGYWRNPDQYDKLRRMICECMNVSLPRTVPYLDRFSFLWFDSSWKPNLQEISYKNPVFWSLTADAADLQYTLHPFLQGMHGGEREPPRPPRWESMRTASASLSTFAAALIAIAVAVGPPLGVHYLCVRYISSGTLVSKSEKVDQSVQGELSRSPWIRIPGKRAKYSIAVPERMLECKLTDEGFELGRISADGRADIVVYVLPELVEPEGFTAGRIRNLLNQGFSDVDVVSSGTIDVSGAPWFELRTKSTKDGIRQLEVIRAHVERTQTIYIFAHIQLSGSDDVYRQVIEQSLGSVALDMRSERL